MEVDESSEFVNVLRCYRTVPYTFIQKNSKKQNKRKKHSSEDKKSMEIRARVHWNKRKKIYKMGDIGVC